MFMLGDFWQLQPCGGTSITSNPFSLPPGLARNGLDLFWENTSNTVRTPVWELSEPMRCDDPWFNAFLLECRFGKLSNSMYNFFHGFSTLVPGSFCNDSQTTLCNTHSCRQSISYNESLKSWVKDILHDPSYQVLLNPRQVWKRKPAPPACLQQPTTQV